MNTYRKVASPGQNLVEFSLLLIFIVFIVIFIFDFGRVIFYYTSLNNTTREGARFGSVADYACNDSAVINTMNNRSIGIDPADMDITVTWTNVVTSPTCKATHPGEATVTVHAVFCFNPIVPIPSIFWGGGGSGTCPRGIILDSSTTMYLEM